MASKNIKNFMGKECKSSCSDFIEISVVSTTIVASPADEHIATKLSLALLS
jgi:hypothetical protein